jgi:tRNA(Ile)-lysidine synthase
MILRHWRAGDRFQPIGMKSPVKLQDLFTNAKIPRERRGKLVLATTADGEIFWAEGLRISENFKIMPQTKRQLVWHWQNRR